MEIELKLEVEPGDVAALLAAVPPAAAPAREEALLSVYFDTAAQELREAGFSLRVRHVGERRIQTVKADGAAAAGLFARPEWEQDIAGDAPELGDGTGPLTRMVSAAVLARIAPVFTTSVRRRIADVAVGDALIELVLDQGDILAGDRSGAICELELELKQGSTAHLFALARTLDEAAAVRLGVVGKSERGYRLAAGGGAARPVKAAPVALDAGMTAADAFRAIAGSCIRQFRLNEMLLARTEDAGALHQARVGLRRLRSALSLFRRLLAGDAAIGHLRGELRWIAATLGEARNLDVLIGNGGEGRIADRLREARRRSYAEVARALASPRLRRLMLDLAEWLALGDWLAAPALADARATPVGIFAAETLDRHRRRVKRRGADLAALDDEARHQLRIEAKKLRYAAEFFATLYPGKKGRRRTRAFLAAMEALQGVLGELNDLATAPLVLANLGLATDPATDPAAAPEAISPRRRQALIAEAEEAYEALIDSRRFWR